MGNRTRTLKSQRPRGERGRGIKAEETSRVSASTCQPVPQEEVHERLAENARRFEQLAEKDQVLESFIMRHRPSDPVLFEIVADFVKLIFDLRHSTPIVCMGCEEPFITAPPAGFAVTRPFTHHHQAAVLGICQDCAERCSDEELAETLGSCLRRSWPEISQIEGGTS